MQQKSDWIQSLMLCADKLRDVSAMGLLFSPSVHDRSNYEAVQAVAHQLFALAASGWPEAVGPVPEPVIRAPTPFSTGDAAIIDHEGRMLLIQRADNRHWAMPGGALTVGETPAEGVVREALEETGVTCEPVRLVGVYDSRHRGTVSRHHLYQFLFLCRPVASVAPVAMPSHSVEVLQQAWYSANALPAPLDPGHVGPIQDAFAAWHGRVETYFNGPRAGDT